MDILYLLVPLSVLLVLALLALFAWALNSQQFEDLEREGERILGPDDPAAAAAPARVDEASQVTAPVKTPATQPAQAPAPDLPRT